MRGQKSFLKKLKNLEILWLKLNEIEKRMIEWEVDAENYMFCICMKGREVEKLTQWIKVHPCFVNLQLKGLSPLHCASNDGHLEVVELLLSLGAKVDSQTQTHEVGVPFSFIFSYFETFVIGFYILIYLFIFIYIRG